MTGPGEAADEAAAAQAAEQAAQSATVAAQQAVATAADLSAQSGQAAADEIRRIQEQADARFTATEERLATWRQEIETQTASTFAPMAERLTTLEQTMAQERQETRTALEGILARLTPPTPSADSQADPNTLADGTQTGAQQRSVGESQDQENSNKNKRTIRKI